MGRHPAICPGALAWSSPAKSIFIWGGLCDAHALLFGVHMIYIWKVCVARKCSCHGSDGPSFAGVICLSATPPWSSLSKQRIANRE